MRQLLGRLPVLVVLLGITTAFAQQTSSAGPLGIATNSLPEATAHQQYEVRLQATGGVAPLHWEIVTGKLPKGLELNEDTGVISGTTEETGDFQVTVALTDSASPPHRTIENFKLTAVGGLSLQWKAFPRVENDQITGSITVANGAKDPFDLTVIVVAVNEVGKAFALGYQRLDLKPDNKDVEIKFGSTLPRGQYVIHADAIADVPTKNKIYRNRLQSRQPLAVTAPSL
jgi:hypothetical protein